MERRRDYRHGFRYLLSLKCRKSLRVRNDLITEDVSASGLRLTSDSPHGLRPGDKMEIQLFARVPDLDTASLGGQQDPLGTRGQPCQRLEAVEDFRPDRESNRFVG